MKVLAHIEKLAPDSGRASSPLEFSYVSAEGDSYESARNAVIIPQGWRLVAWLVPEHLPQ